MNIPATLEALRVPVDGLVPYEGNARRGNVELIAESLKRHGQYRPIVVRSKTFEVLAGNHTLRAAKQLGWSDIAATFVDVSDDEAARIVLVDNRANDVADNDDTALLRLLEGLDHDFIGTGYDEADLLALLNADADAVIDGDAMTDEPPIAFGVVIECENESEQISLLDRLSADGLKVRALM